MPLTTLRRAKRPYADRHHRETFESTEALRIYEKLAAPRRRKPKAPITLPKLKFLED